jgi:hypothetical protein
MIGQQLEGGGARIADKLGAGLGLRKQDGM